LWWWKKKKKEKKETSISKLSFELGASRLEGYGRPDKIRYLSLSVSTENGRIAGGWDGVLSWAGKGFWGC
jgi:hypothetical protein